MDWKNEGLGCVADLHRIGGLAHACAYEGGLGLLHYKGKEREGKSDGGSAHVRLGVGKHAVRLCNVT